MRIDPSQLAAQTTGGLSSLPLSDAAGLRQFGAFVQTLEPGASTGERHWHTAEDEFLFVLDGTATLQDEGHDTNLAPGDAACFRHGEPKGHAMVNRSTKPCRWVMVGARVQGDICHYVNSGRRKVNGVLDWYMQAQSGQRLNGGPLPAHLCNLLPPWGQPYDGTPNPRVIHQSAEPIQQEKGDFHPILGGGLGDYAYQLLSDPGGLTQFGAFVEILPPGSKSGFRHWHADEDEMIVMLDGDVVLSEQDETHLSVGDVACWPAGRAVGHCLHNRFNIPARYLVVGTRRGQDVIHYPDHDLVCHKAGKARAWFHADGRPRG